MFNNFLFGSLVTLELNFLGNLTKCELIPLYLSIRLSLYIKVLLRNPLFIFLRILSLFSLLLRLFIFLFLLSKDVSPFNDASVDLFSILVNKDIFSGYITSKILFLFRANCSTLFFPVKSIKC